MQAGMLRELQSKVSQLQCVQGHACKVKYVNKSQSARQKFLCDDCLHQNNLGSQKSIVDLAEYFEELKDFAMNKRRLDDRLLEETGTALDVIAKLKKDIADSLGAIKTSVDNVYDCILQRLTRNIQKCKTRVHSKMDHDMKRSLSDLNSLETNLRTFKDGTSPFNAVEIIDQASNYVQSRSHADNSLFDLLGSLNLKDSLQNAHVRLNNFGQKYIQKRTASVRGVKECLLVRFNKDKEMFEDFSKDQQKIMDLVNSFLPASEVTVDVDQREGKQEKGKNGNFGNRKASNSVLNNAKMKFIGNNEGRENSSQPLGKRQIEEEAYDPKKSFLRKFGDDRTNSVEQQISQVHTKISLENRKPNRLQSLLNQPQLEATVKPQPAAVQQPLNEDKQVQNNSSLKPSYSKNKRLKYSNRKTNNSVIVDKEINMRAILNTSSEMFASRCIDQGASQQLTALPQSKLKDTKNAPFSSLLELNQKLAKLKSEKQGAENNPELAKQSNGHSGGDNTREVHSREHSSHQIMSHADPRKTMESFRTTQTGSLQQHSLARQTQAPLTAAQQLLSQL